MDIKASDIKKAKFLSKLKGTRNKYKRYLGSPLRYAGGKSLAVGYVVEMLPDGIKKVVSPFFGGGSVEIAISKELGLEVIGYDIFDILTNYWQVQTKKPLQLATELEKLGLDDGVYVNVKETLKKHWKSEQKIKNQLELATHYFYNHNLSYGPGFLGWMSKIYKEPKKFESMLKKVRDFKAGKLNVSTGDFAETIPKHKNDFLYLDPPYFLEGDSKMFKGIYPQRNFPIHHNGFDHTLLSQLLSQHQGGFILSYNDCTAVREFYKDYQIKEVEWQYTMGQGETRIGLNRINQNQNHIKKSHEVLIYKPAV